MRASSFYTLKMIYITIIAIVSCAFGIVLFLQDINKLSDHDIKIAGIEYCMYKKRFDNVEIQYNKCMVENTGSVAEKINACRKNAYELSTITDYYSDTAELRPNFISSYNKLYIDARTPTKAGKILPLPCDKKDIVNVR